MVGVTDEHLHRPGKIDQPINYSSMYEIDHKSASLSLESPKHSALSLQYTSDAPSSNVPAGCPISGPSKPARERLTSELPITTALHFMNAEIRDGHCFRVGHRQSALYLPHSSPPTLQSSDADAMYLLSLDQAISEMPFSCPFVQNKKKKRKVNTQFAMCPWWSHHNCWKCINALKCDSSTQFTAIV